MKRSAPIPIAIACSLLTTILHAGYYVRGPVEKGGYVSTMVEDVRFPQLVESAFVTFLYTSYENGAPFYTGIVMKGAWERNIFSVAFWRGSMKGQVECLHAVPVQ